MTDLPQEKVVAPVAASNTVSPVLNPSTSSTISPPGPIQENKEEVNVETLIPMDDYRTDPLFYAVADYFNIPSPDYVQAKDYISEIVDYAIRETKSNDPTTLLVKIREIEDKVQTPQWGEKRYWNVRKYVRLAARKNEIEKAMTAFTKKDING